MSHILINAATGAPVPLPYYCEASHGYCKLPATIHDFDETRGVWGVIDTGHTEIYRMWYVPGIFGLAIITEEEFMARQEPAT